MTITAKADPLIDTRGALIGYNNLLVSASGNGALALTPNTYERWTSASGTVSDKFQLSAVTSIDFVGIAAHNLSSAGVTSITISTAATIGGALTTVETITPTSNSAIMRTYDPALTSVAEIQIEITGGTDREIGVVSAGQALRMQRPIYGGHNPIDLSAKTEYQSVQSDTGQFLGRTITNQGTETQYQWRHLEPDWYRDNFQPFVENAKTTPFFIKWRPDLYPDAVVYGHTTTDIRPQNMGGGHGLMSVNMTVRGHSD
jgi:hypothetical protein